MYPHFTSWMSNKQPGPVITIHQCNVEGLVCVAINPTWSGGGGKQLPITAEKFRYRGGISSIWWVPWHNWCWSCWQIGSVHNVLFKMFCSQYVVQNVLFTICCSHASLKPTDRVWSVRSVAAEKAGKKVNSFFENKTCVATHFKVTFCRAELSSKKEIS